jgi:hypothetical protein
MPFPTELTTPPVQNMYFGFAMSPPIGYKTKNRAGSFDPPSVDLILQCIRPADGYNQ